MLTSNSKAGSLSVGVPGCIEDLPIPDPKVNRLVDNGVTLPKPYSDGNNTVVGFFKVS